MSWVLLQFVLAFRSEPVTVSRSSYVKLTPVNADRKPDKLPTTVNGAPMASVAPGPIAGDTDDSFTGMQEPEDESFGGEGASR